MHAGAQCSLEYNTMIAGADAQQYLHPCQNVALDPQVKMIFLQFSKH